MAEELKNALSKPIFIHGKKNSRIALYRYENRSSDASPLLLTHGTFSNARICQQLAIFLNTNGFDCWIYEWSGHGLSDYGARYPDAEDFAEHDVPLVIKTILDQTNASSCIWVAHSGGGFLPLMYMARNPDRQHELKAIVGIGSQTTGAGGTWMGRLMTIVVPLLNQVLGKVPGPLLGLGPEDEVSGFLAQWSQWNRSGRWIGKDGFDYTEALSGIHIPTLLIAGAGDFIAPPDGCQQLFHSLGGAQNKFVLCSVDNGFAEEYNHPRLIASQNAKREIWPLVLEFIRSTLG